MAGKKLICVTQHEGGRLFKLATRKSWKTIKKELVKNRQKLVFNPIVEKIDNNAWHMAKSMVGQEMFFSFIEYNGKLIQVQSVFYVEGEVVVEIWDSIIGDRRPFWVAQYCALTLFDVCLYESIYE